MSKIIRTVRLGGPVVTLGVAERELYEEGEEQSLEAIGLESLLDEQVQEMRNGLEAEWEDRLRQEMQYLRSEADKRLEEAETRFAEERAAVHQERYEEGYKAGLDEREKETTESVSRIEKLHENLIAERAQVLKEAEETVIDLVAALVRRIVGFQVEMNPKALVLIVRNALGHLSDHSNLEIKVHPDDLQIVRRFAAHWVDKVDQDAVLKVRASEIVARGGCMIEGLEENVDARLEEQTKVLHDGLRAALFGPEAGEQEAESVAIGESVEIEPDESVSDEIEDE